MKFGERKSRKMNYLVVKETNQINLRRASIKQETC